MRPEPRAFALGSGQYATRPGDLSDLLLQDVETTPCTRMSRIEDAVRAVQAFVQRARLGLEPTLTVTAAFARLWDKRFASLRTWQSCRRREIYLENWIEWDDLRVARRVEAFRFLEDELRRSTLTVPVPGGGSWWPSWQPPAHRRWNCKTGSLPPLCSCLRLPRRRDSACLAPSGAGRPGLARASSQFGSGGWRCRRSGATGVLGPWPSAQAASPGVASDRSRRRGGYDRDAAALWLRSAIGLGRSSVA